MSKYRISIEDKVYEMELELLSDNENKMVVETKNPELPVKKNAIQEKGAVSASVPSTNTGTVVSPMPGTVLSVLKTEGDKVKKGDVVLVLEAMKMENEISAPIGGTIFKINVSPKVTVAGGDLLFEIK